MCGATSDNVWDHAIGDVIMQHRPNRASAYYNLASARLKLGYYADAELTFRQTLAADRELLGDEHPNVLSDTEQLAMTLKHQQKFEEAELLQRDVLARRISTLGASHPQVATAHVNLASIVSLQGDLAEAEQHCHRAIGILEPVEPGSQSMFAAKAQLASIYWRQGLLEQSEVAYVQLLEQQRATLADDHPDVARTLHGLGIVLLAQRKPAAKELQEALRIRESVLGADHPDTIATRSVIEHQRDESRLP